MRKIFRCYQARDDGEELDAGLVKSHRKNRSGFYVMGDNKSASPMGAEV